AFVLFVAASVTGGLPRPALATLLADTMATTGALFALLAAATTFTLVFRALGTDRLLDGWIDALPRGAGVATLVVLGVIGLSAFALDAFEIIFVLVPVLMPPLLARVPDASWVAVLVLLTLQASFLLPPVGYALLMTRGALGERVSTRQVARQLLPFLCAQLLVFAAVFAFPDLVHYGQGANVPAFGVSPAPDTAAPASMPEIPSLQIDEDGAK
ncbi:MAG TPA: TRAP transporter large permease subunit, partial [Burkholderiaceae bacterium]|nr:TRAP transporter large permease subunit [Burkholderiaceae bacterium]